MTTLTALLDDHDHHHHDAEYDQYIELADALMMLMMMTTMAGLITIFMEFVGQAYVRLAGGSSVEGWAAAIIITGQPMYYPLQSPKF